MSVAPTCKHIIMAEDFPKTVAVSVGPPSCPWCEIDRLRNDLGAALVRENNLIAEGERLRAALTLIAGMKGLTLIAPSLGPDADRGHQIGANKAFNQAAEVAASALNQQLQEASDVHGIDLQRPEDGFG